MMNSLKLPLLSVLVMTFGAFAGESDFTKGPLIDEYGPNAAVKQTNPVSSAQKFKVAFDIAKNGPKDSVNKRIESLARFLNMHVKAGVPAKNIELALVVHGSAGNDVLNNQAYRKKFGTDNPNLELVDILLKHNVKIFICGQSAAYHDVKNDMLVEGVAMALSAMTAHALLQQDGYTLNPF